MMITKMKYNYMHPVAFVTLFGDYSIDSIVVGFDGWA